MATELKEYDVGDIIAIMINDTGRAVSCKATARGLGQTKNGKNISFDDDQVIWKLGYNGKWPNFVYRAFRGEGVTQDAEAKSST